MLGDFQLKLVGRLTRKDNFILMKVVLSLGASLYLKQMLRQYSVLLCSSMVLMGL